MGEGGPVQGQKSRRDQENLVFRSNAWTCLCPAAMRGAHLVVLAALLWPGGELMGFLGLGAFVLGSILRRDMDPLYRGPEGASAGSPGV